MVVPDVFRLVPEMGCAYRVESFSSTGEVPRRGFWVWLGVALFSRGPRFYTRVERRLTSPGRMPAARRIHMATAQTSPNDLTRQQLDELDALLQRMLSLPISPESGGSSSVSPPVAAANLSVYSAPPLPQPFQVPTPAAPVAAPPQRHMAAPVAPPAPRLLTELPRLAPEPEPAPLPPPPAPAPVAKKPAPEPAPRPTPAPLPPPPVVAKVAPIVPKPTLALVPPPAPLPLPAPKPPLPASAPRILVPAPAPSPVVPTSPPPAQQSGEHDTPLVMMPLVMFNSLVNGTLGLFGFPGRVLRSGFVKSLFGLTGLGLMAYTGAKVAQLNGWISLPEELPWPR